jgi:hypothetical protein
MPHIKASELQPGMKVNGGRFGGLMHVESVEPRGANPFTGEDRHEVFVMFASGWGMPIGADDTIDVE